MRHYLMAVALSIVPMSVAAQSGGPLPQIETQTRVRVWTESTGDALKARVQTVTPETLEVIGGTTAPRVFHVDTLERIDVSRGRNRWAWSAGGMLLGATVGVLVSRADNDEGSTVGGLDETAEGLANTFSGALVGGVLGFIVAPERWRTVWRR